MIITDEKWNDIIAETRSSIDKWNENARKHQRPDVFRVNVQDSNGFNVLLTEHLTNGYGGSERKIVVREIATGEMRRAKISKHRGRVTGFRVWKSDPKVWRSLADKPGAEIAKRLKLTNFLMILGSQVTHVVGPEQTSLPQDKGDAA
jgi:hypothetical protein